MGRVFYKRDADVLAFGLLPAHRRYELRQARYMEMIPALGEVLRQKGDTACVLDIGSGTGEAKLVLDTVAPRAEWTGVEMKPDRVAECRRRGYVKVVDDVNLETTRLPFPDASFDVVIASHILEHLSNTHAAFADWYRVLKPGGLLLIGVPMHLVVVSWLMRLWYRLRGRRPYGHCVFFSMPSLRRFLHGYEVLRIWGFRVLSARKQLPLEDWAWFYRVSMGIGRRFPNLTQEVNVLVKKPPAI
ncbi:MAG: class I SAM-dependent methyltransferase [Deltaproteobacteria bacterium]|nr:class I SAM-dependent methyltransferase [Deltaproteobacteria bacterium]